MFSLKPIDAAPTVFEITPSNRCLYESISIVNTTRKNGNAASVFILTINVIQLTFCMAYCSYSFYDFMFYILHDLFLHSVQFMFY